MKTFSERFIELCMQTENYTKAGVKRHNRAVKELSKLYHEAQKDHEQSRVIYSELMDHEDERVRETAAAHCLGMNTNVEKAKRTFEKIFEESEEPLTRFNAEMTLKIWEKQGLTF